MEGEQSLANLTLGEAYVDEVTGFTGIAIDKLGSLHDMPRACLENDSGSRWLPFSRLKTPDGEPVIGEFTIPHASAKERAVTH